MADDPKVVQIPVTRHDVNLTLQDIVTPLTTFAQRQATIQALAAAPEAQQHAAHLSTLASQILALAAHIDAVAPHLLSPAPPAASTPDAPAGGAKDK